MSFPSQTSTHPLAKIFQDAVMAPDSNFKFNHIYYFEDSINCNSWFPQKNGYRMIYYTDADFPEHLKDSDMAFYTPPHPDKDKSFFFWKDYSIKIPYEENKEDPEYMTSHWRLFVLDGSTRFWHGDKPDYSTERWCLHPNYDDDDLLKSPIEHVPISCNEPDNETATDYNRRQLHYRKEKCSWALIDDCNCSSNKVCSKIENENYCCSEFSDEADEEFNSKYLIPKMISLGTNVNSLLGLRMAALDATEPPPEPEYDEYMHTFCTA